MRQKLFFAVGIVAVAAATMVFAFSGVTASGNLISSKGSNECDMNRPLEIHITNRSFQRVTKVTLRIELWANGVTKNVLDPSEYNWVDFHYIIEPFSSETFCLKDPFFDRFLLPDEKVSDQGERPNSLIKTIEKVSYFKERLEEFEAISEVNVEILEVEYR